jgi:hypothetical protein
MDRRSAAFVSKKLQGIKALLAALIGGSAMGATLVAGVGPKAAATIAARIDFGLVRLAAGPNCNS